MNETQFKNDWRNMGQLDYLAKKKLQYLKYTKDIGDHEHCEFCADKISFRENDLNFGYCTLNKYYWICDKCYDDFKDIFGWSVVPN